LYIMIYLVRTAFSIYRWLLLARVLISWVNPNPYHPAVRVVYDLTEPVLQPCRGLLPTYHYGIDFSPMIALLGLGILERLVIGIVYGILY
jgi:YggT family protein